MLLFYARKEMHQGYVYTFEFMMHALQRAPRNHSLTTKSR